MLKFAYIIILLLSSCTVQAQIVKLACPEPLNFTVSQLQSSNNYSVSAYVRVLQGSAPAFLMAGVVAANSGFQFVQARFRRGEFTCEYRAGDVLLSLLNEKTFGLDYCYFDQSEQRNSCAGSNEQCALLCEMLK